MRCSPSDFRFHFKRGRRFGYPTCCVVWYCAFSWLPAWVFMPPFSIWHRLGVPFEGRGYIPCPYHYKQGPSFITKGLNVSENLKNFDPKLSYPGYEGMSHISNATRDTLMEIMLTLITDMTIHGASRSELARAVRHSMVVIDSHKYNLDYIQSANDHGIAQLKAKYQTFVDEEES